MFPIQDCYIFLIINEDNQFFHLIKGGLSKRKSLVRFLYHRIELGEIHRKSSWRYGCKFNFGPVLARERKILRFFSVQISIVFHAIHFRRVFRRPSETNSYLENRPLEMKTVNCKVVQHTIFNNFVVNHFSLKLLHIELWLFKNTNSMNTSNPKTKRICKKWSTGRF